MRTVRRMPMPARPAGLKARRSSTFRVRQVHRWLGLVIGIQFVLWTVGGLYFAWTDLDEIHGDHLRAPAPQLDDVEDLVSPSAVIAQIRAGGEPVDSLAGLGLAEVLGRPTYRVDYFTRVSGEVVRKQRLADASTGEPRADISRQEAIALAEQAYTGGGTVRAVELLQTSDIDGHHEYRGGPLPAWAITFDAPGNPTAYIPAREGHVRAIRHRGWRTFDFLWMLHTMDFVARDDFNNALLRAFSVLGLVTVLSGFLLFLLTSRWYRGWRSTGADESGAIDPAQPELDPSG